MSDEVKDAILKDIRRRMTPQARRPPRLLLVERNCEGALSPLWTDCARSQRLRIAAGADGSRQNITKRNETNKQALKIRADVELTNFAYDGVLHIKVFSIFIHCRAI